VDGTCGAIALGSDPDNECATDAPSTCGRTGVCDGAGACQLYAAGATCRASTGQCDVAETCPGAGAACPADGFASSSAHCTGSSQGGVCDNDAADHCSGAANTCVDAFQSASTVCRASAGQCDVAESCTGAAGACPVDGFASSSAHCTGSSQGGACDNDAADHCSGAANTCVDAFQSASTVCRASAGQCDVAESCTGTAGACPVDGFASSGTHCTGSSQGGACDNDAADHCSGAANTCVDTFRPASTVCRASAGPCDVAESCTGTSGACPSDAVAASGTVCRAASCSNAMETPAGTCNGTSTTCTAGPPAACPGNYVCADATTCKTSCSAPADCTTNACSATVCLTLADGSPCTSGTQCTGTFCYVTGGGAGQTTCHSDECSDGLLDGTETSIDCGGSCATCTVLIVAAGASSTVGGEYHPDTGWATSTTLGGMSVDGLALTFLGGGSSAVGLMRFTQIGNMDDNALQSTTWTPGSWTAFSDLGAGITTTNAPTVGAYGTGALGAFRGTNDLYYYATFSGGAWSSTGPVEPSAGGQSSGPQGPSFDGSTGTFAFGGDNDRLFAQTWSGTSWGAAQTLDSTNVTSLSPTVTGIAPTGSAALVVYVSSTQIFYVKLAGGTWSAPTAITNAFTSDPVAVTAATDGGAVLAFRGTDGNLYDAVYDGTAWSAVSAFSASSSVAVDAEPALAHGVGAATAEIAFVQSGVVYHARLIGGSWTTPAAVGGTSLSHVSIASAP
jgi:hypothetical protein